VTEPPDIRSQAEPAEPGNEPENNITTCNGLPQKEQNQQHILEIAIKKPVKGKLK